MRHWIAFFVMASFCQGTVLFRRGETAYVVAAPQSDLDRRVLDRVAVYVGSVTRKPITVVRNLQEVPGGRPAILLAHANDRSHSEAFRVRTSQTSGHPIVSLDGMSERGLKRAAQRAILKSRQTKTALEFPDLDMAEEPWIAEREWTMCPWVPQKVRGAFVNPYADNRMDITLYGDEQTARYMEMYDWFGFSGVQLMDTSYSYGVLGSPQAFHARQKKWAQLAKENGQNVSLWVWAAEFTHGWSDPEVVYAPRKGMSAFEDPDVRRSFEKYYDMYAELAPYVDRLIGHFYDPGHLSDRQDVFRYMRLLEQKFKAKNPRVQMTIDSWGISHDYLQDLIKNGFTDYLLLEMTMPNLFQPGMRERFHEEAKRLGLRLGIWGWYTTEYETDQLASMYVNAAVLKSVYQGIRDGAMKIHPVVYWSEMEAHHLNNIYSMYSSSQLLWNPERDTNEVLRELVEGIWGPINGPQVFEAVKLIQDLRSGPDWNTYWWRMPGYRLGTSEPNRDLVRVRAALKNLQSMRTDPDYVPQFPLPFPPATFIELMLPHLRQMEAFAIFRIELEDIRQAVTSGQSTEEIAKRLAATWKPIREFDTWIGTFGTPEARLQEISIQKLAQQAGVSVAEPGWVLARDSDRVLQKVQNMQRSRRGEFHFDTRAVNEFFWPPEKMQRRIEKLVADGSIQKLGPDTYRLADWQGFVAR